LNVPKKKKCIKVMGNSKLRKNLSSSEITTDVAVPKKLSSGLETVNDNKGNVFSRSRISWNNSVDEGMDVVFPERNCYKPIVETTRVSPHTITVDVTIPKKNSKDVDTGITVDSDEPSNISKKTEALRSENNDDGMDFSFESNSNTTTETSSHLPDHSRASNTSPYIPPRSSVIESKIREENKNKMAKIETFLIHLEKRLNRIDSRLDVIESTIKSVPEAVSDVKKEIDTIVDCIITKKNLDLPIPGTSWQNPTTMKTLSTNTPHATSIDTDITAPEFRKYYRYICKTKWMGEITVIFGH